MLRVAGRDVEVIPLARPVIGEAEEQAVLEVLRSRHLSLGPRVPGLRDRVRRARRRDVRERGLLRHGRAAPRAAGGGRDGGRRGRHLAVLVRGLGELDPLRAGAAGVRGHRSA